MFFPVFFCAPPRGKLGLLYSGGLLTVALFVLWRISMRLNYIFEVSPEMQIAVQQANADVMWAIPYMQAANIIGIIGCGVLIAIGYWMYKCDKVEKGV